MLCAGYLSLSLSLFSPILSSVFLVFLLDTYCFGPPGFRTKQLPEPAQLVAYTFSLIRLYTPWIYIRTCVGCLVGSHLHTAIYISTYTTSPTVHQKKTDWFSFPIVFFFFFLFLFFLFLFYFFFAVFLSVCTFLALLHSIIAWCSCCYFYSSR